MCVSRETRSLQTSSRPASIVIPEVRHAAACPAYPTRAVFAALEGFVAASTSSEGKHRR